MATRKENIKTYLVEKVLLMLFGFTIINLLFTFNASEALKNANPELKTNKKWRKDIFWMLQGDISSELNAYTKIITNNPNNYEALVFFGVYNFRITKNNTNAIGFLEKARFVDPNNIIAYQVLYKIYYQLHDKYQGIKVYKEYVEIKPDNSDAHLYLADAYFDDFQLIPALKEYIITKNINHTVNISSSISLIAFYLFLIYVLPFLLLCIFIAYLIRYLKKHRRSKVVAT